MLIGYIIALLHYNVLADICQRMGNLFRKLVHDDVEFIKENDAILETISKHCEIYSYSYMLLDKISHLVIAYFLLF